MVDEAIVLAGGLGTRIRQVVKEVPKPMAPVGDQPFLAFVLDQLVRHGVSRIVLSVGYKREVIERFFGAEYRGAQVAYAVEQEPLGTGGGVLKALTHIRGERCLVLNGDSFFNADLHALVRFHLRHGGFTLALKELSDFDRYGVVRIDAEGRVIGFEEKGAHARGLVNCGIYVADTAWLRGFELPERFSFERDFLERVYATEPLWGLPLDGYFVDIGIPQSYLEAQSILPALR